MKKFENYVSNLNVLLNAKNEDLENEFILGGIINKFHVQFELSWKVLKEILKYEGVAEASSGSPREIIKAAYSVYDFIDEDTWLSMLQSRNSTAHIYDGNAAKALAVTVIERYTPEFVKLQEKIKERYKDLM